MQAVQSGMSDGVEQGEGAMANINAGIGNLTGALTEMKDETLAGAQDLGGKVAAKGKEYGDKIPTREQMEQKVTEGQAKAQAAVDADRAEWGVQEDGLVDTGVLTNKVGKALDPKNLVDGFNTLVERGKEQGQQVEAGHAQGKAEMEAEIAAKKVAPAAGGRRRRRRRKSRKKRRKSKRKSRKKRRKSKRKSRKKRKRRRSRRSKKSRRRRRR